MITPESARLAASVMVATLEPVASADWGSSAGGLEWSCQTTLEHVGNAMDRYAMYLAGGVTERLPFRLVGSPEIGAADVLRLAELRAAVLSEVARAASSSARGFHVFGRSDSEGYIAMGCIEMLVHTDDIARGLGASFNPPSDLIRDVVARLFPWAPTDADPWLTMQWVTGRADLPGHDRVNPDWAWHAAPLSEWDGTVKTRASYR